MTTAQRDLKAIVLREGYADARSIQVELLDDNSCRILNRLIRKVKLDGERRGQRQIGKAIARGFVRP